jgi:hypothetical protein
VCGKEVVRKIIGPKRDEVKGEWRLHKEEFCYLHFSPYIIRVIKSIKMRWARHIARMGGRRGDSFGGKTSGKEIL